VKANRVYELRVNRHRGGPDSIEVLDIASMEIALFWDLLPHQTRRMARALRADLAQMDPAAFLAKWSRYQME
jgi:hypothetical protein